MKRDEGFHEVDKRYIAESLKIYARPKINVNTAQFDQLTAEEEKINKDDNIKDTLK